jgi:SAM-dependent methyltransferase
VTALHEWARRRRELFDDPAADGATVLASLRDIARANRLFGGAAAALARLDEFFRAVPRGTTLSLLDVGTGEGDIPRAARRRAARRGVGLRLLGLERHPAAARRAARGGQLAAVRADARALPFGDRSVDLVLCSQLLHHFRGAALIAVVAELARVARLGVVVADLRPSPLAAAGIWLASFPLAFHPVSRRDGVLSVLRGFTATALRHACAAAGVEAEVRTHPGFRVTAAWRAAGSARPQ